MKFTKNSLTVHLRDEDVALIIRSDGSQELFIPQPKEEDDLVPHSVLAILVLANQLNEQSVSGLASQFRAEMGPRLAGPGKGDTIN